MKKPNWMERFAGFTLGINPIFAIVSLIYLSITRTRGIWAKIKSDKANIFFWSALAISGVISIALAINKSVAIGNYFIPFLFIWMYILGRWAIDHPDKFLQNVLRGIACLAIVAIVCRVWNISWYIGSVQILSRFGKYGRGEILYVADNSLGLLFQAGVVGAVGLMMTHWKNKSIFWQNGIIFVSSALGVVISGSRGAMMGVFVAIGYLMLQYGLKAILGGAGLLSIFMVFAKQRFLSIFQLQDHNVRLQVWKTSFKIIKDYPWFGVGPGNFGQVIDTYKPETIKGAVTCAHSNYLNIFIGWGIIGGVLFWGWQLMLFIRTIARGTTPIQRVIIAILISYYAHVSINDLFTAYAGFFLGLMEHKDFTPTQEVNGVRTLKEC